MATSDTYRVVTTGQILEGFDPAVVRERLVSALRLKPEVAARFFEKSRVVKKDVNRASADKICAQLAKIGVAAEVQSPAPAVPTPTAEPTPAPQPSATSQLEIVDYESSAVPREETIECPNCQHVQPKAEQCENCGAWFHKFEAAAAAAAAPVSAPTPAPVANVAAQAADNTADEVDSATVLDEPGELSPVAIGVAAAAALVGAWVWKFIGVNMGYEFGLIAWGIGGAVGFAAAAAGSRGMQAGIICGVLALGSIGLGKYWTYSAFVDEFEDALTGVSTEYGEMNDYYEQELADARFYVNGSGSDEFVRNFMLERGYTYETSASSISDAELADFREYVAPALIEMAESEPDYDEWQENSLEVVNEMSPLAMMRESLGLLDIIFAFLGIGTAFRLGSRSD